MGCIALFRIIFWRNKIHFGNILAESPSYAPTFSSFWKLALLEDRYLFCWEGWDGGWCTLCINFVIILQKLIYPSLIPLSPSRFFKDKLHNSARHINACLHISKLHTYFIELFLVSVLLIPHEGFCQLSNYPAHSVSSTHDWTFT